MSFAFLNVSLTDTIELVGVPDLGVKVLAPPPTKWEGGPFPARIEDGGGIAACGWLYKGDGLKRRDVYCG